MASSISARSTGSFPEDSVMLRTLQKDGNILVFTFATALNASGGFEKNIRWLTGMNIRKDLRRKVRMQYAEKHSQDPLVAGLDTIRIEQGEMMPLFYVDDPTAVPLRFRWRGMIKILI